MPQPLAIADVVVDDQHPAGELIRRAFIAASQSAAAPGALADACPARVTGW